jgi:hypothetical protein
MQWFQVLEKVRPYIVRILTPYGSGTGFLVSQSGTGNVYGIATAAHVVSQSHDWEMPIKIEHFESRAQLMLRHDDRAIFIDSSHDSAVIVFDGEKLNLPPHPPTLIEEGKIVKVGVELGWLGFPAVAPQKLCFFSGRISAHTDAEAGYLVDGVAINGVSGGPALSTHNNDFQYVGVVSAYIPNRATGEPLPGLAVVSDVTQFQELVKTFRTVDEAQAKQAPPDPKGPAPEPTPPPAKGES